MAGCGPCSGCCAQCGSVCGAVGGASAIGIAGAFRWGSGLRGAAWGGAVPTDEERTQADIEQDTAYFSDDLTDPKNPGHDAWVARQKERLDTNALVDPDLPGHRDAVQTISHVNDATHESILRRIRGELAEH
jgi:hypothetical protein